MTAVASFLTKRTFTYTDKTRDYNIRYVAVVFSGAIDKEQRVSNLRHDLWVWFSDRVSPLHGDWVAPHLDFPAH